MNDLSYMNEEQLKAFEAWYDATFANNWRIQLPHNSLKIICKQSWIAALKHNNL